MRGKEPPVRTWVTVDLGVIRSNLERIRARAGGRPVLGVVKADAYGHGGGRVGRFLQACGCERLAVATTVEALALRDAGLRVPVHILASVPTTDYGHVMGEDFVFTVGSAEEVEALAAAARSSGSRETVHLEVDTAMGRSGCRPADALSLVRRIAAEETLVIEGAMTHFPSADEPEDPGGVELARRQVAELERVGRMMVDEGVAGPVLHAANSAGVAFIEPSLLSFVRPGGALYGLSSGPETAAALGAEAALTWSAVVVQVRDFSAGQSVGYGRAFVAPRDMRIATVAAGYGDGYARSYGPGGSVLTRDMRAPIVGRVSMDSITVDVSAIQDAGLGDEVVLLGRQGSDAIPAEELAARAGTSPYEVTCRVTRRVPRFYRGA
ncbi:MAG: alanine racemase [Planctomycetota bacterium]